MPGFAHAEHPDRRRPPQLSFDGTGAPPGRGVRGGRRGGGRRLGRSRGAGAASGRRAPRRAAARLRRVRGRAAACGDERRLPRGDPDLEQGRGRLRPARRGVRRLRVRAEGGAFRARPHGTASLRTGRLWLAYWVAALVVGAIGIALVLTSDHEDRAVPTLVLGLLLGWSFIASGLVARARSPDNPTGRLMVAFGFVWFLGALTESNTSLVFTLGAALSSLFAA